MFFFFQAEDGIRDDLVTGVQTCALPIWPRRRAGTARGRAPRAVPALRRGLLRHRPGVRRRRRRDGVVRAHLRVSEAAQLVGVSPSTLRAWESSDLIKPSRSGRNRWFSPRDVKDLQQIASLRAQGFNVAAIRSMLRGADGPQAEPADAPGPAAAAPQPPRGEKLRAARRRRGLSLREASGLAGPSVSHLSAIEWGDRNTLRAGRARTAWPPGTPGSGPV